MARKIEIGLKLKILFLVGFSTGLILVVASLIFTFQSKAMILEHLKRSSESVTRAFSVFVLDAMIKDVNGLANIEDVLGHFILDFKEKNPKILAIAVVDSSGHFLAGHGIELAQDLDKGFMADNEFKDPVIIVQKTKTGNWVSSVFFPVLTGSREWGRLVIHFRADKEQKEVTKLFWMMLVLTISLILSVLFLMGFFLNRVTSSLGYLKKEMDAFDPESEEFLTPIKSQDEIGMLFSHFNDLKSRLAQSRLDFLKAQKQVYHAEKLASIGRFASGMAHEINNPLNGIQSCLYAIKKEPENMAQTREYLELATEGLEHIEMVVRKLLGFARKQSPSRGPVDLEKELQTVLGLLEYKLNEKRVQVTISSGEPIPRFLGDPHLVQELLMNLALNSYDALSERQEREGPSFNAQLNITLAQSTDDLFISFRDNGFGIPEEEIEHIFDPFFTTKEQGKGTGLGLSVALGIAQAHGGSIHVQSENGQYCDFKVTLPMETCDENSAD